MEVEDAAEREPREVVFDTVLRAWAAIGWAFLGVMAVTSWPTFRAIAPLVGPFQLFLTYLAVGKSGPLHRRPRARATVFLGALTALTLLGFVRAGPLPGPYVLGMAAVLQAALFLHRRAAMGLLAVIAVGSLVVGAAYQRGVLAPLTPEAADPTRWGNWLRFALIFGLTAVSAVLAMAFLIDRLDAKVAEERRLLEELRAEQARRAALEDERLEVQRAMDEAQKLEALGRLAGGVAHDYRNSLAVVRGWIDLMRADDDPETWREGLDAIDAATSTSTELTQRLLAIARREIATPTRLDLAALVQQALVTLRPLLPAGVELTSRLAATAPISADRAQVERVLLTLVLNARDAMPDGGMVTVETREIAGHETPRAAPDRSRAHVVLAVRDTGPGYGAEAQAHVFEPFYAAKGPGGKGLGLALVHAVATQAGGYVELESEVGRGSTFVVGFPTLDVDEAAGPPAEVEVPSVRRRPPKTSGTRARTTSRVLIVEDEVAVAETTRRLFESLGYETESAATADEAVARLAEGGATFDLVCTDGRMPGMRVTTFLEVLRERWPSVPVLVCSGYMDEDLFVKQSAERFVFLAKPFGAEALRRSIDLAVVARADRAPASGDAG